MLNSGKKMCTLHDKKNKYSNSCVVRKKNSERNKNPYPPPLQVKWSVPNKFVRSDDSLNELSKTDDYQLTKCFHSLIRWNIAM